MLPAWLSLVRRKAVLLVVVLAWCLPLARAQYDFPVDSCACHIHYEIWVQLQYQLSQVLTSSFPDQLFQGGSPAQRLVLQQDCGDPRKVKNLNEWTLAPASSDCAPGHMSHFILCAQANLLQGDVEAARLNFEFANYLFPLAMPCMDPVIWTITPKAFYERYRVMIVGAEVLRARGGGPPSLQDLRSLAWKPADG